MKQIFNGDIISNPSIYLSVPSLMDPEMAPNGKSSFYVMIPVSDIVKTKYPYYDEHIDYYCKKAIDAISSLPGMDKFEDKIELELTFTPLHLKKNFLLIVVLHLVYVQVFYKAIT